MDSEEDEMKPTLCLVLVGLVGLAAATAVAQTAEEPAAEEEQPHSGIVIDEELPLLAGLADYFVMNTYGNYDPLGRSIFASLQFTF
jgi:hypothetical protein